MSHRNLISNFPFHVCPYNVTLFFFFRFLIRRSSFVANFINEFTPQDGAPNQILNQVAYSAPTRTAVVYLSTLCIKTMQPARKVITLKMSVMQLVSLVH